MFIDARTIKKGAIVNADVCIIGAGAAGITLAREFRGGPHKICLLEAGGLEYDEETQALYKGQNTGLPYHPLDATRLRFFGGTTNHWGGACRPLDDIDFEARDWVPYSGWPFNRAQLLPFYKRAQSVFQLGPFAYDGEEWETSERRRALFGGGSLTSHVIHQTAPTRFGKLYREEIGQAPNIDTYLNANVLEIETNESARSATRVRVSSLQRNEFFVSARLFVIATGGIENARLLLLSNRFSRNGLGNSNDLVGRFFMEHPNAWFGNTGAIVASGFPLEFYGSQNETEFTEGGTTRTAVTWGFITPKEETLRRNKLLNCGIALEQKAPALESAPGITSARMIKDSLAAGEWPSQFWKHVGNIASDIDSLFLLAAQRLSDDDEKEPDILEVMYWAEQCPNPDSRVRLSSERDFFDQRRVQLEWRLTERDEIDLRRMLKLFANELGQSSLGRLGVNPVIWSANWTTLFKGSNHHMGTTRMHKDPKKGVVDANCRVHGVSNVYVAGSSVFPTAGHANPTLTIVALALRLADHIKPKLG